ncbi:MAG: hypothetical protein ACRDMZ_02620, partial [Solirubrobacteraceae bacterium]
PAASAVAPTTTAADKLPARARQLLAATDAPAGASAARRSKATSDPFEAPAGSRPPSSSGSSAAAKTPGTSSAGGGGAGGATKPAVTGPIPVIITGPDGKQDATPAATPATTPPAATGTPGTATTTTAARSRGAMLVDVRFGKRIPARLQRAIPRLQTFAAGGRIVAIFVKYSPNRDKAVFAIAPSTLVRGDIECRRKQGLCRYVDIPVGKGVRLTTLARDGSLVTRRLDVVRIARAAPSGATAASSSAPDDGRCLLGRMLSLGRLDVSPASDACPS